MLKPLGIEDFFFLLKTPPKGYKSVLAKATKVLVRANKKIRYLVKYRIYASFSPHHVSFTKM